MPTRLPPAGFLLSDTRFDREKVDGYDCQIADGMRKFYPELSHWHDSALVEALGEYGENVEWSADFSIPQARNEDVLGYLYACQVMPVYQFLHFEPKRLEEAWQHFDAGTSEAHALDLFDRVPVLQSIFKTKESMLVALNQHAN